jgi:hypothetical protein
MANYVTDGAWGTGLHRLLAAAEIDDNFWEALSGLQALIDNPLQPEVPLLSFCLTATPLARWSYPHQPSDGGMSGRHRHSFRRWTFLGSQT